LEVQGRGHSQMEAKIQKVMVRGMEMEMVMVKEMD
jgi:hypothetical protein